RAGRSVFASPTRQSESTVPGEKVSHVRLSIASDTSLAVAPGPQRSWPAAWPIRLRLPVAKSTPRATKGCKLITGLARADPAAPAPSRLPSVATVDHQE